MHVDIEKAFSDEDKAKIEEEMKKIIKEDLPIERFSLPRKEALELMKDGMPSNPQNIVKEDGLRYFIIGIDEYLANVSTSFWE